MRLLYGDHAAREVSKRIGAPVASVTVLKQTPADRRVDGQVFICLDYDTRWVWNDEATCSGDGIAAQRGRAIARRATFRRRELLGSHPNCWATVNH